jgi:hypothetical protein
MRPFLAELAHSTRYKRLLFEGRVIFRVEEALDRCLGNGGQGDVDERLSHLSQTDAIRRAFGNGAPIVNLPESIVKCGCAREPSDHRHVAQIAWAAVAQYKRQYLVGKCS